MFRAFLCVKKQTVSVIMLSQLTYFTLPFGVPQLCEKLGDINML